MEFIDLELLMKLGISAILGMVIGLERELKNKPVGLKTSLVISIVSCLLTFVSIEAAYKFPSNENVNITMDPLRLAAQIVSGIGFLGAGVILRRGNDTISGLTTAAIIWGAAGLGIAVGIGYYVEAIIGAALLIISVEFIPFIFGLIGPRQLSQKEMTLDLMVEKQNMLDNIVHSFKERKITILSMRIKNLTDGGQFLSLVVAVNYRRNITDVYHAISTIDGISNIEIGDLQ